MKLALRELFIDEAGPRRHQVGVHTALALAILVKVIDLLANSLSLRQDQLIQVALRLAGGAERTLGLCVKRLVRANKVRLAIHHIWQRAPPHFEGLL